MPKGTWKNRARKPLSKKVRIKISNALKKSLANKIFPMGENHPSWNWDTKNYASIHKWLFIKFGKANKCENHNCENKNIKRYEWALIKGKEYARKRENFMRMCASCHRKYDYTEEQKRNHHFHI